MAVVTDDNMIIARRMAMHVAQKAVAETNNLLVMIHLEKHMFFSSMKRLCNPCQFKEIHGS